MSTPEQDRSRTPPPKTPGWGAGLFGMFSTAKKPRHVAFSREATMDGAPSPSTANNSFPSNNRASSTKLNLSNSSSKTLSPPSAISPADVTSLLATTTDGDSPVVLPPSSPTVGFKPTSMATKSPWKSPSRTNGVRFSHGVSGSTSKSKASVASQKVVPFSAQRSNRRRVYKPKSHLLVTQKLKRPAASIDPALAVHALERSKNAFAPSTKQLQQKSNYASFKHGKRLLGASQRATRLPSITYQDEPQPEETDDANTSAPSSKRQKNVSFTAGPQEENAPVVQEVATPARIHMPRKATPFKSYASMEEDGDDDDDDAMEEYTPSHSNKKSSYPPLPKPVDLLSDTFAEPSDLGPAVAGETRPIYNILSTRPDASTKTPKKMSFATYVQAPYDNEIAAALQKEKEEKEVKKKEEEMEKDADALLDDKGQTSTKKRRTVDATWTCACGVVNPDDETRCLKCGNGRSRKVEAGGWGSLFVDRYKGKWKCDTCSSYTDDDKTVCASCETERTGGAGYSSSSAPAGDKSATAGVVSSSGFSFGGASTSTTPDNKSKDSSSVSTGGFIFSAAPAPAASSGGGFTFGGAAPAASASTTGGGFTFGGSSPAHAPSSAHAPATSNGGGGFTFTTSSSTTSATKEEKPSDVPGFSFGSTPSKKKSEETAKATFSFGAAKPLSTPENGDKSRSLSGSSSLDTKAEIPAAPKFSFGAAPTDGSSTPAPLGSIKPQAPATEPNQKRSRGDNGESLSKSVTKDSKPTFSFGSQPTAEKDSANDSKATFSFGGSSESAPAPAVPKFSFGSTPAAAPANSQPITPAVPLGSVRSEASDDRSKRRRDGGDDSKNDTPAPAFGATSSSSAAPPAPSFSFGKTPAPAPALSGGNLFGSTPAPSSSQAAATTFGSKPGDSSAAPVPFGNAPVPAPTAGGFSFGQAPAPAPAETPQPAFSFGGNSGSTGGQPSAPPMFGNDSSAPASAPQMLGGTPALASAAPPMFGASTAGQPGSAPAPQSQAFGSTPNPFGDSAPAPAAPTQGFSFGSTPGPAPATTQGFGSAQAQAAPGGFGSTPNPPAQGGFGSTPAQAPGGFGSTPAPPTPGFSYGGAPPQQQAPGPAPFTPFGGAPTPAPGPSYGGGGGFNSAPPAGGGFGGGGFNSAPQQPAQGGFGGGGFGGTPNPTTPGPQGGGGFSIGSSGAPKSTGGRRRFIKARRPGGGGAPRQA
jgi:hypothetical protein